MIVFFLLLLVPCTATITHLNPDESLDRYTTYLWREEKVGTITVSSDHSVRLVVPCGDTGITPLFTCSDTPVSEDLHGDILSNSFYLFCSKQITKYTCNSTMELVFYKRDTFALITDEFHIDFQDATLRYPWVSQLIRAWSRQYSFGYIFGMGLLLYILSLYRIRLMSIPSFFLIIGGLATLAWIVDSFIQILYLSEFVAGRATVGFLINVVANIIIMFAMLGAIDSTPWKIIVGVTSAFVGGGGGYICPLCAFAAIAFTTVKCPQSWLVCNS